MRMSLRPVAALALLLATTACGGAPAPGANAPDPALAETLLIQVTNENLENFDIYLVTSGSPTRLGLVSSGRTERFAVPRSQFKGFGQVVLQAQPLVGSGRDFSTQPVVVNPGEWLDLRLSLQLERSRMVVRR